MDLPDVILIDGGKGQLNTVKKYLDEKLIQKIRFISVSKGPNRNEKYDFCSGQKSYELKNSKDISKLLQLVETNLIDLQSIIIERRSKELFSSSLDGIDGLGPKLKTSLIRYFGGIDKVIEASLEDLKLAQVLEIEKQKNSFTSKIKMNIPNFLSVSKIASNPNYYPFESGFFLLSLTAYI